MAPVDDLALLVGQLRARRPLIHYLPNWVTANDVANSLLAVGASPIMAVAVEEVAEIRSDALVLNLGTPTTERIAALLMAGHAAAERGVPIVLDPVGVGATPFRRQAARRLLAELPVAILRLNAAEGAALLDLAPGAPGIDVVEPVADAIGLAQALARRYNCVAAVTGATDVVGDGTRTLLIDNGHPLLPAITGAGCMVTGLVATCATVTADMLLAAGAALVGFGVASELAGRQARAPGSLRVALLDALYQLDGPACRSLGRARWI
jgi:hydroxyethylthiazole kinase